MSSGLRDIEGLSVTPLDGLWDSVASAPIPEKLTAALKFSGCLFHDEQHQLVSESSVSIVGLGGLPVAYASESDNQIAERVFDFRDRSRMMMGSAAAFSYLNSSNQEILSLYDTVMDLGHFSVAHTVQANILIAGVSEATELELSLQRDLVHLSKLTNTRTAVQCDPPIVVRNREHVEAVLELKSTLQEVTSRLRSDNNFDTLEIVNGLMPVNKATLLMLSGDLANFRKLLLLRYDTGKERELRDTLYSVSGLLARLWPEVFKDKE